MTKLLTFLDAHRNPLKALVVMASEVEYGARLKAMDMIPSIIGIGPVEAAVNLTMLLNNLAHANALPDLVINLGSAGSDHYAQKTILQASSASYRDIDVSPFGFVKGETPFSGLPPHLPIDTEIPGLERAAVSTGAAVISNNVSTNGRNEYDGFPEAVAEMEAYALYTACIRFGIPFIKIMGISDGKQALEGKMENWTECLGEIDAKLAEALLMLKAGLADGSIPRPALPEGLIKRTCSPT